MDDICIYFGQNQGMFIHRAGNQQHHCVNQFSMNSAEVP